MAATLHDFAEALALTVTGDHGFVSVPLPAGYSDEYVTISTLTIDDVDDENLTGERWVGSWSVGPRTTANLDEVLTWLETDCR